MMPIQISKNPTVIHFMPTSTFTRRKNDHILSPLRPNFRLTDGAKWHLHRVRMLPFRPPPAHGKPQRPKFSSKSISFQFFVILCILPLSFKLWLCPQCHLCGRAYPRRKTLNQHIKRSHQSVYSQSPPAQSNETGCSSQSAAQLPAQE